jgi:hypothetical protein
MTNSDKVFINELKEEMRSLTKRIKGIKQLIAFMNGDDEEVAEVSEVTEQSESTEEAENLSEPITFVEKKRKPRTTKNVDLKDESELDI